MQLLASWGVRRTVVALLLASIVPTSGSGCGNEEGAGPSDAAQGATDLDAAQPDTVQQDGAAADGVVPQPGLWVSLPAGKFLMGSPKDEGCRRTDENQHEVTLTHGFEIRSTEVTQRDFEALMGYNNGEICQFWEYPRGKECPITFVTWHEAAAYCNALSVEAGHEACYGCTGDRGMVNCEETVAYSEQRIYDCPGYRLPTEAEWEYAYRAGTQTPMYNGRSVSCTSSDPVADEIAWYGEELAGRTPHPVGQKAPNAWQLYDMAGNVGEWCHDGYQEILEPATDPWGTPPVGWETLRVLRGGSWFSPPAALRAASRGMLEADFKSHEWGFRCARTVTP